MSVTLESQTQDGYLRKLEEAQEQISQASTETRSNITQMLEDTNT